MNANIKLNHPWTLYHNEPISGYTNYKIYREETQRLYNCLSTINNMLNIPNNTKYCVNMILGTPMEGVSKNQWQQLFPSHIKRFIDCYKNEYNIKIFIIIVSPDKIFENEFYVEPEFTKCCTDFEFNKIENRYYKYTGECLKYTVDIDVNIFTCPHPEIELRIDRVIKYNNILKNNAGIDIDTYEQTEHDIFFVNNYYELLEMLFCKSVNLNVFDTENISSNLSIIINSYATFKNVSGYENYNLFPRLLTLLDKYKLIATEWDFIENSFCSRIVSKIPYVVNYIKYMVNYADLQYNDKRDGKDRTCIIIDFPYKLRYAEFID